MTTIVRFAPSPTGRIHIGNARTAILNWLMALKSGGQFVLRYDDTDTARSTQDYADGIATDIDWLGIKPHRDGDVGTETGIEPDFPAQASGLGAAAARQHNRGGELAIDGEEIRGCIPHHLATDLHDARFGSLHDLRMKPP